MMKVLTGIAAIVCMQAGTIQLAAGQYPMWSLATALAVWNAYACYREMIKDTGDQ